MMFMHTHAGRKMGTVALMALVLAMGAIALFVAPAPVAAANEELQCWVCDNRCLRGTNPDFIANENASDIAQCDCSYAERMANPDTDDRCKFGKCCPIPTGAANNPWYSASKCEGDYGDSGKTVYEACQEGLLPFCTRTKLGCQDINDILLFVIRYGKFLFGIAGSVALLFTVIGGMLMLFSFGNSETLQKGRKTLTAAVVGLIIVFAAYLIVAVLLKNTQVLGVPGFENLPL